MIEFSIHVDLEEALKPYTGPDPNQKYPGEDDLIWCERCECNHRRGAGWEIERERMVRKAAQQIADRIDADTFEFFGVKEQPRSTR